MKRHKKVKDVLYILYVRFQKLCVFTQSITKKLHPYESFDDRMLKKLRRQLKAEARRMVFFDD